MIENIDILFRVSNEEEEFRKSTATAIEEPPNINHELPEEILLPIKTRNKIFLPDKVVDRFKLFNNWDNCRYF